jgi:hypothetical protein
MIMNSSKDRPRTSQRSRPSSREMERSSKSESSIIPNATLTATYRYPDRARISVWLLTVILRALRDPGLPPLSAHHRLRDRAMLEVRQSRRKAVAPRLTTLAINHASVQTPLKYRCPLTMFPWDAARLSHPCLAPVSLSQEVKLRPP